MGSRAWILTLLRDLRASYWFLPLVLVALSQVLAFSLLWLERTQPELALSLLPAVLRDTQPAGARGLLSLMASSVIGVTGVMFSLTMVAVSFASGNFGPRLVGNFMRDRGNQWSLGILIATFAFCLQSLRAVKGPEAEIFVPHLSVGVAFGLTMISVLVMIYFIHHVPETINVGNIIAGLGRRLEAAIRNEIADPAEPENVPDPQGAPLAQPSLGTSGYVRTLDLDRLRTLRDENGWIILLRAQPGDFVTAAAPVVEVHPGESSTAPDEEACDAIRACFALGDSCTEEQNPLFVADQLVEIAARALSPGVNDPFTAHDCLNRMYGALDAALTHEGGLTDGVSGPLGRRWLDFPTLLDRSFAAALPYVADDPMTRKHLSQLIARLRPQARNDDERRALDDLSERLERAAG
ncbi:DUF2254 domain-containing protein [Tropicimonas aquimaris]|uniref:DUF2254 domain-containing protein n=1 Tax=Tropicimonas aquimaris TaxID=914152 RepID=A0ABW3IXB3_9RHOB